MTHLPYILAAYGAAAAVVVGLVAWVAGDIRFQKRRLARLEAEGARRRSAGTRRLP